MHLVSGDSVDNLTGNPVDDETTPISSETFITDLHIDTHHPAVLATFHPAGDAYEIEAKRDTGVRVNGVRVMNAVLSLADVIEIEDPSVLIRYTYVADTATDRAELKDVLSDCVKRTRHETRRSGGFLRRFAVNMTGDLSRRTTRLFRVSVLGTLAIIIVATFAQWNSSRSLRSDFEQDLLTVRNWLSQQQTEYISREEWLALREDIDKGLKTTRERVMELESRDSAAAKIVQVASSAVVFLQGSYSYVHKESGEKLRYLVTPDGRPLVTRDGTPLTSLEGEGPVVEHLFTGTAFVINDEGVLLTNRHVALPYENDERHEELTHDGLEPVINRFIGYLPGVSEPFEIATLIASDSADLALLQCGGITNNIHPIEIADTLPSPGDEVFVLGYPTGLRALLARTDDEFIDRIRSEQLDFWSIATALAERGAISPLTSRGIVGQVSGAAIAYDADTTSGGSGGPVLNHQGRLVAINNAILPEYGGSNLGVPVSKVEPLLNEYASKIASSSK
ncbi:MAG: hypothetical protein DHS20C01_18110 [marine bacterium B5-7]|nr:MAG: hypothetical protein DHS20C01_18110 [marine bacterium B5-7]